SRAASSRTRSASSSSPWAPSPPRASRSPCPAAATWNSRTTCSTVGSEATGSSPRRTCCTSPSPISCPRWRRPGAAEARSSSRLRADSRYRTGARSDLLGRLDDDRLVRDVLVRAFGPRLHLLDLPDDVHPVDHLAEDRVAHPVLRLLLVQELVV